MDPFLPNNTDHNTLRDRLNQIIASGEPKHDKSVDSQTLL